MVFTDQSRARRLPAWSVRVWQAALALTLAALAVWATGARPMLALLLYVAAVTGELCHADVTARRLPNALIVPGYGVAAVAIVWQSLLDGTVPLLPLAAGGGYLLFLLILHLGGGMGMGDVKLAGLLGLALGSLGGIAVIAGPVLGFVFGGIAGLVTMLTPAGSVLARIPFGPYMLAGFWAACLVGAWT